MNIIKRNGSIDKFDGTKIYKAILKAMEYGSGVVNELVAKEISEDITIKYQDKTPTIHNIETDVYLGLVDKGHALTAKAYEGFRAIQSFKRETNTTDESILGLLDMTNDDLINENSNKNAMMVSTQRDLIAGEVSKDIVRRKKIPPHIIQAHDSGALHLHDQDYLMQKMFNCCLINIQDMLDNGTVINKRMIDSPKTFQVACTIMTQIIAQVASSQFGGQSVNIGHLGKYLRRSREKYTEMFCNTGDTVTDYNNYGIVDTLVQNELEAGVQTIQYQINTLMTTNGRDWPSIAEML